MGLLLRVSILILLGVVLVGVLIGGWRIGYRVAFIWLRVLPLAVERGPDSASDRVSRGVTARYLELAVCELRFEPLD